MWKTKIRIKHNCIFGNSCEKAKVASINVSFNCFKKGNYYFVYHFGTVFGDNYKQFLNLLKKDKRTNYIEIEARTYFVIEKRTKKEIPGMYITPEIIYTKPIYIDNQGYETWCLAAIKKETLMDFVKHFEQAKILTDMTHHSH